MAKNSITDWSTTAASNTDIGGIDIQGTAAVSNHDNGFRELMSQLADTNAGTAPWADTMTIGDAADLTKEFRFEASGITAATTRVLTVPDHDGTILATPITSTDAGATGGPDITLYRNSASPLASDVIGRVLFTGEDSAGNTETYAIIQGVILDPTTTQEDAALAFQVVKAGTVADILTLNTNAITYTPATTNAVMNTNSDANALIIQGGNTASQGGQVFAYGDGHATAASDVAIFSDNVEKYRFDASAAQHKFATSVNIGTFSLTGATEGVQILPVPGFLAISNTGTSGTTQAGFYNANGQVGSISTSGSATAYNTSSDERMKQNFRPVDSGPIIDAIKIHKYDWKGGGSGVGPKAQELHTVFPDAVTPGQGNPGDKDFRPWGWDASKLVPVLVKEIQELRKRVAAIES